MTLVRAPEGSSRADAAARAAGWLLAALAASVAVVSLVVALRHDRAVNFAATGLTNGAGCCLVAALILDHRPRNGAAWALAAVGVFGLAGTSASVWAGLQVESGRFVPWSATAIATTGPQYLALLAFCLLFPDGAFSSRRWRLVLAGYTAVAVLFTALLIRIAVQYPVDVISQLADVEAPAGSAPSGVLLWAGPALAITLALGLASLTSRFRHGDVATRRSLGYALAGAAISAVVLSVGLAIPSGAFVVDALVVLGPLPFMVAVGAAMRGLYGLDRVVRPVVTWAVLSLGIAAVYAGVVVALGTLTNSFPAGSAITASAATLAAAAVFRPLLVVVRREVDRRFDRQAWRAVRTIDEFSQRLGAGAEPAAIEAVLRSALGDETVVLSFPVGDDVLSAGGQRRILGPPDPGRLRRTVTSGGIEAIVDVDARLERQPRLMDAVLSAAALPLQNAALHARAAIHVAEIQASRERIVQAGDVERRRIERDLHDGIQQRLVALALRLRLAERELLAGDGAGAVLGDAVTELLATVEQVRDVTHGILPPVLTDEGLAVALQELAQRTPVRLRLEVATGRFPATAEATAWFIACEGITNAVKHSGAEEVAVAVSAVPGGAGPGTELLVEVTDNGAGGGTIEPGGGLQGLADRVAAVGGRFDVTSAALDSGSGTRLRAWLPCAW